MLLDDYWQAAPDPVMHNTLDQVCASESYHDGKAFRLDWDLAMANIKKLAGWKLAMAMLHRCDKAFREDVDWLLLLDTLHEIFGELSGRQDTPPAAVDFFEELHLKQLMVAAFRVSRDSAMGDPAVNAVALLNKLMMLTAHIDRVPSLREHFIGIMFGCFYLGDQMHEAVFEWIREKVAEGNEFVREAVRLTLVRNCYNEDGDNFRTYFMAYLSRTVEAKETGAIALAKYVTTVNWFWSEQVVLSRVITPLIYSSDDEMVVYGISCLGVLGEGKQELWRSKYGLLYGHIARLFESRSYNIRMQCVIEANDLGLMFLLEERYKKEPTIRIQMKIIEMIEQHGAIEWLYCTKKKDGKVLSRALDCVLKKCDDNYLSMMDDGINSRDSKSRLSQMLNFFLVSWQNLVTGPFCDREDDLERRISMLLGEGMPYRKYRLDLLLNIVHLSNDAKAGFRSLWRTRSIAREMLIRVKNEVLNAAELRAFAPRPRPGGMPTAPSTWQMGCTTLRDEYIAYTEYMVGNGNKRYRPCTEAKWQGLWRRFGLFMSPKLVTDMLTEVTNATQQTGRIDDIFSFIVAFRKMMFSMADYELVKTWAPMVFQLLERCPPKEDARAEALMHVLSILGKIPPVEPFQFLPPNKAERFCKKYYRRHPKFVANAMHLWACGHKPLEILCEPLETCKHALALAGCIQSKKLQKIADKSAKYTITRDGRKTFDHATDEATITALGRCGVKHIELVAELGKKETGSLAAGLSLCRVIRKKQANVDSAFLFALLRAVLYFPDDMADAVLRSVEANKWKYSDVLIPLASFLALSYKHQTVNKVKVVFTRYVVARNTAVRRESLTQKMQLVAEFFAYLYSKCPPSLFKNGQERLFLGTCDSPAVQKVMKFLVKGTEFHSGMELKMDGPVRGRCATTYWGALAALQDVITPVRTNEPNMAIVESPPSEERYHIPVDMLMGRNDDDEDYVEKPLLASPLHSRLRRRHSQ